ncbi:MAG: hypothetical protein CSB47_02930 [Proteobacteria bacterium]|nr:MAG: hypothetical protein CSB47_02930 [Pseudomonadota bacterium]
MVNNLKPRVEGYPAYLEKIKKSIEAEQDSAKRAALQKKLKSQTQRYENYKKQLAKYEKYHNNSKANMDTLDRDQNVFRTINKPIKSLYTIDDESLVRYQKYKKNQDPDYDIDKPTEAEPFTFSLNKPVNLTDNKIDDFIRIQSSYITLDNLTLIDDRALLPNPNNDKNINAHWDAIQLIPQKEIVKTSHGKAAFDQMAGAMINNLTITNNKIIGYKTPLQGIFMSDGLVKDINIKNNTLLTQGGHSITLTGVTGSNSNISNNNFLKFSNTPTPVIQLDPFRIGGNMLREGLVYVTGFDGTSLNYGSVEHSNNKLYTMPNSEKANVSRGIINFTKSTSEKSVNLIDNRQSIPDKYKLDSVALTEFRYADFKSAWFSATIASFANDDPEGLQGLRNWLGGIGSNYHVSLANQILNDGSLRNTSISMLRSTLLRVWILKRVALRHGNIISATFSNTIDRRKWEDIFKKYLLRGLEITN